MTRVSSLIIGILLFVIILPSKPVAASERDSQIARGKYLVERVAMCADCHSPRDEQGQFVPERWLQGEPLNLQPINPIPNWSPVGPSIAGLPDWSEREAIQLFETALTPTGQPLRPPMPAYKMLSTDAESVVAYLKSLKTKDN